MNFDDIENQKICNSKELAYSSVSLSKIMLRQMELFDCLLKKYKGRIEVLEILNTMLFVDNLKEASDILLRNLCKKMYFQSGIIKFFDANSGNFMDIGSVYCKSGNPDCINELSKPFGEKMEMYLKKEVFEKNKILMIDDIREGVGSVSVLQKLYSLKANKAVFIPVSYHQQPIALIFLAGEECFEHDSLFRENIFSLLPRISVALSLFRLNDRYKKTLEIESDIKDILSQVQTLSEPYGIFDIAMKYILDAFDVDGVLRLTVRGDESYELKNVISRESFDYNKFPRTGKFQKPLIDVSKEKFLFMNDVQRDIMTWNIKQILVDSGINSIVFYPNIGNYELLKKYEDEGFLLIYTNKKRVWTSDELYWISLIYDTISLAYSDLKKRFVIEETKNNFVLSLTHDLKAPLLAEQKALEMIIDNNGDVSFINQLVEIQKMNSELIKMINDLLSVYHYENFEYKLFIEKTDIKKLIAESIQMWKYLCAEKKCRFSVNAPKHVADVYVDRREIKRIFSNLISNAIKHCGEGVKIVVGIEEKADELEISVKDNGPGISPEDIKHIFTRYYTKKREVGNGLGLFIAKQIIEAHHGNIRVESTAGKGTVFYFTLPTVDFQKTD